MTLPAENPGPGADGPPGPVLLAHEWLAPTGGSENVFEQMRLAIPSARAVSLWNDDPARFPGVEETWLARSPLRGRKAAALPFMSSAWNRVDLAPGSKVVASSHAFAHHLAARAARRGHEAWAYVHSPARYLWTPELDDRGDSLAGRAGRRPLRSWDRSRVDSRVRYAANSHFVADRIRQSWGMDAEVIYPPVDVARIRRQLEHRILSAADEEQAQRLPDAFVLGASRFVPYKRLDLAIRMGELLDLPVVLAGSGPDEPRIREMAADAGVPVHFAGRVSDELLIELYARATVFSFMAVEDFGIMPVEAMAAGTPVVVNEIGGARESVAEIGRGVAVGVDDLADATELVRAVIDDSTGVPVERVERFSNESFRRRLTDWVGE